MYAGLTPALSRLVARPCIKDFEEAVCQPAPAWMMTALKLARPCLWLIAHTIKALGNTVHSIEVIETVNHNCLDALFFNQSSLML